MSTAKEKMYVFEAVVFMRCDGYVYAKSREEALEKLRNDQYDDLSEGTYNIDPETIEILEGRDE